ncbi:MAG: hypothetical protein DSY80_02565, partial [Desulfocapsa sp.]
QMQKGRELSLLQREWQFEDIARARERLGVQYGWTFEDIDRAIRFASGRQKIELIRRRDREEISYAWQTQDLQTREERLQALADREDERYQNAIDHLKEIHDLQERVFSIQQAMMDENRNYTVNMIALQKKQREVEKARFDENATYTLENIKRELEFHKKWENYLKAQAEYSATIKKNTDDWKTSMDVFSKDIDTVLGRIEKFIDKYMGPGQGAAPKPGEIINTNIQHGDVEYATGVDAIFTKPTNIRVAENYIPERVIIQSASSSPGGINISIGDIVVNADTKDAVIAAVVEKLDQELEYAINQVAYRQSMR